MKKIILFLFLFIVSAAVLPAADTTLVTTLKLDKLGGNSNDMDFANATTGYVVGSTATFIAKTTDGGITWQNITANSPAIVPNCVDFINASTGFAAGTTGSIIKTTNGGLNWTAVSGTYAGTINDIAMLSADTIFACGTNNGGGTILKSVNGGVNWTIINPGNTTTRQSIEIVSSSIILVSATTDMRRSTDGGTTWNAVTITGAGTIADMEAVSATDIWAASTTERIYKSTDAGASFTLAFDAPGPFPLLSVSFWDANTGIFTGGNTTGGVAYKTTNGGATFDTIDVKKYTAQIGRAAVMLSAANIVCAADMGCILRTTDGGANWNYREFGSRLYSVDFINATTGVTVGWRGAILKTSDGGNNWTHLPSVQDTEGELYDVKMFDANTFYACGDGGRFFITTNGGANFTARPVPITNAGAGKTLFFFNQNQGYYGGEMGQVYYTSDAGVTWTSQFSFGTTGSNNIEDIYFANDSTGYAMGDQGKFVKTTNRSTWDSTGIDLPTAQVYWTSKWLTPTTGYIGSINGRIFKSTDGGVSWALASDTAGMSGVDVIDIDVLSAARGFAAAELGRFMAIDSVTGMFKTQQVLTAPYGTEINVWGVDFVSNSRAFMCGYNSALYRVDITFFTSVVSGEIPAQYTLAQNYPNPFNPATTINFSIPVKDMVKLSVYDITGRLAATLVNTEMNAGEYKVNFNASGLSSGIYFYKLETGSFTKTMKMILMK